MLTIIHGDDIATSRNLLLDFKKKFPEAITINGENVSLTDLVQILEGDGLFNENKTIIIEQILSRKRTLKSSDTLLDIIKAKTLEKDIILWEGKELDKKVLSLFPHSVVKTCNLPQTLFLFLDSLRPGNGKKLISLYHKTLETVEPEMVFHMLMRQVRILLSFVNSKGEFIDEVKRLAPWQLNKYQKQAKFFSEDQLLFLHKRLYMIDYQQKTGILPVTLDTAIDMLLLEM